MFYTKFCRYCELLGKSPYVVASEIGVKSTSTIAGWRSGSVPRPKVVDALVKYFRANGLDIDVEDLFADDDDDDEIAVREMLRNSPEARVLFNATKDAPASALLEAAALITRYKEASQYK